MPRIQVFICGAHSTGKTTLLNHLVRQRKLDIHVETEAARGIIKTLGWKRKDFEPKTCPDNFYLLQLKIMQSQCQIEAENVVLDRSYISDRGIDPLIYCKMYLGDEMFDKLLNTEEGTKCIERHKCPNTLTVILKPHPECIIDDGTRLPPKIDELNQFTDLLIDFFTTRGMKFTLIPELDLQTRAITLENMIQKKWME